MPISGSLPAGGVGFLRGDFRFGNNINGKAVNAGLRMQF